MPKPEFDTSKVRRFAEGTTVSVGKSRDELETLLQRRGASQIQVTREPSSGRAVLIFGLQGRMVRLELKAIQGLPDPTKANHQQKVKCPKGWGTWTVERRAAWSAERRDQIDRERWRRWLLQVKAKLELAFDGESSVEREFLADILLPDGKTVHQGLAEELQQSYATGSMPRLLPGSST